MAGEMSANLVINRCMHNRCVCGGGALQTSVVLVRGLQPGQRGRV